MLGKKEIKNKTDTIQRKLIWILWKLLPALYHTVPRRRETRTHTHGLFMVLYAFKMKEYSSVKSLPRYLTKKIPTEGKQKSSFKREMVSSTKEGMMNKNAFILQIEKYAK